MMSSLVTLVRWCSTSAPIVFFATAGTGCRPFSRCIWSGMTVFLAAILVLDLRLAGVGMMD